jgi:hypothetical protein
MNSIPSMILLSGALAVACATAPADSYWEKPGASSADFASDNESCGARASRMTPTPRADQLTGGAAPPRNRMDTPPRPRTSAVGERAYMECMSERGWRVVTR